MLVRLEGRQGKGCRACTLVVQRVGIPGALSWCIAFVIRKGGHMLFCSKQGVDRLLGSDIITPH
jgi:hypothetical protein